MAFGGAQGGGGRAHGSVLSVGNTTTTPLSSGATYTGTWERATADGVTVSCKTDNTGTLYFDFSNDGTNADTFPSSGFEVASGVHEYHTARVNSRFFRVRLVNDTGAQSYLRIYTYYGTHTQPNAPINQTVGTDQDATWVRPTIPQDEISIGRRTGVAKWNKFGYKDVLTSGSGEEMIWPASGNFTPLESASTFTIAYDGTGGGSTDGSGTNGATQLTFYYVDSDGNPAVAAHNLGTDGSDETSFSGYGINRVAVSASGSADSNQSAITITATTGGTTQAYIPAGESVTQQCVFVNGANHDAIVKFIWINVGKPSGGNAKVTVKGYAFNRTVTTRFLLFKALIDTASETTDPIPLETGFNLSPTDVLYFVADTDTTNALINLRFDLNQYART